MEVSGLPKKRYEIIDFPAKTLTCLLIIYGETKSISDFELWLLMRLIGTDIALSNGTIDDPKDTSSAKIEVLILLPPFETQRI